MAFLVPRRVEEDGAVPCSCGWAPVSFAHTQVVVYYERRWKRDWRRAWLRKREECVPLSWEWVQEGTAVPLAVDRTTE